jgi:hypothetical protein
MQERRVRRSTEPEQALKLYLEAVKSRAQADTVVFADAAGLVVSGTGSAEQNEILAICGPTPSATQEIAGVLSGDIRAAEVRVDGSRYYLASLNGAPISAEETASAVARILFAA